ncbi:MAG: hypothetical protein RID42_07575 [Alphaproteobacteria bacterium]
MALAVGTLVFFQSDVSITQAGADATIGRTKDVLLLSIAYEFDQTKWLAITVALMVWAVVLAMRVEWVETPKLGLPDMLLLGFAGLAVLSLAWTPDPRAGALALIHGGIAVASYILMRWTAPTVGKFILFSFGVTSVWGVIAIWAVFSSDQILGGTGNDNFLAEFTVVAGALSLAFAHQEVQWLRYLARVTVAAALVFVFFVPQANLQILALIAIAIYALAWRGHQRVAIFVLTLIAIATLSTTAFLMVDASFLQEAPINVRDRLQIWVSTIVQISHAPVFGHGVGSFLYRMGDFTDSYASLVPQLGLPAYDNFARQAGAADNELLQVASDFGLVGAIVVVAFVLAMMRRVLEDRGTLTGRLGFVLAAAIPLALVSQTFEKAFTIVPILVICAWVARNVPVHLTSRWSGGLAAVAMAIFLVPAGITLVPVVKASWLFSEGDAFEALNSLYGLNNQLAPAAGRILLALDESDKDPRLRLRAFPQVLVAGPDFWTEKGLSEEEIEGLFALSSSASPHNTLLIDLRLKQLLSSKGRSVSRGEVESLLSLLHRKVGWYMANPHVLEAAIALQVGEPDRARAALERARSLIKAPLGPRDTANLENIEILSRQLGSR